MAEYIDRNTAIAKVTALEVIEPLSTMVDVKRLLADMPAADVAPVRHGRWAEMIESVEDGYTGEYYEEIYYNCLNCDYATDDKTPYCPNCGAKMRGSDDEDVQ